MREIKFRVWDKEENEMISVCMFSSIGTEHSDTLMQYTGLKDKNGKEIYEGDIVKCKMVWDQYLIEPVEYDSEYGYRPIQPDYDYDGLRFEPEDIEVIGNIYENHELIIKPS